MIDKFEPSNTNLKEIYKEGITEKEIEELVLKIDPTNEASHKVVQIVGYEQVDDMTFKRKKCK